MAEEAARSCVCERSWRVGSPLSLSTLGLVCKETTLGRSELHQLAGEASTVALVTCKPAS